MSAVASATVSVGTAAGAGPRSLRVSSVRFEADDIVSLELVDPAERDLPPFTAGAHVDVVLPSGLLRSYSLANSPAERSRYLLGVHRTQRVEAGPRGSTRACDPAPSSRSPSP